MSLKKAKEMQEQTRKISMLLKAEGYTTGVIALGADDSAAVNVFGTRKDALKIIYHMIKNLNDKDKLILLAMLFGISLGGEKSGD